MVFVDHVVVLLPVDNDVVVLSPFDDDVVLLPADVRTRFIVNLSAGFDFERECSDMCR